MGQSEAMRSTENTSDEQRCDSRSDLHTRKHNTESLMTETLHYKLSLHTAKLTHVVYTCIFVSLFSDALHVGSVCLVLQFQFVSIGRTHSAEDIACLLLLFPTTEGGVGV